jgi:hypothetical protein
MPSSERVTTRELADKLDQLVSAITVLATNQKQMAAQQAELADKVAFLSKSEQDVMADLQARLDTPEQIRDRLERAPKVEVVNTGEEARQVALNGVKYVIAPGPNTVPAPIAAVWNNGLKDERFARDNAARLAGARTYDEMEQARQIGR